MNFKNSVITFLAVLSFGGTALAQVQASPGGAAGSANATSKDNKKGEMVNQLTGVINVGMGTNNVMQGNAKNSSSTCGCAGIPDIIMGVAQIGLGILNFSQQDADSGHGATADQSYGGFSYAANPSTSSDPLGQDEALAAQENAINDANKKLAPYGVKISKDGTISTKDGKKFSKEAFKSAAAFAAAGGDANAFLAAVKSSQAVEKKALEKLGGLDEMLDGGGGAGGIETSTITMEDEGGGYGAGSGKEKKERNPTSVAGLSKDFNGDRIGVAADNIFDMIKRRYELKDKQNTFLNDGGVAPTTASAIPIKK